MSMMLPADLQILNETHYGKREPDRAIRALLENAKEAQAKIQQGGDMLREWLKGDYYASKNARLDQLDPLSMNELTLDCFVEVAFCLEPTPFVNIAGKLAHRLDFAEHKDAINTIGEVLAVLSKTGFYTIYKKPVWDAELERTVSLWYLESRLRMPDNIKEMLARVMHPLPLVIEPEPLQHNHHSPYLTFNESQISGKGGGHHGHICLDILDRQNQIPLSMDMDFLRTCPEAPSKPLNTLEQQRDWNQFKQQSNEVYLRLYHQGNKFYLTNKVDSRGRIYAVGYHINPQGSPFKKAMLEFADKEVVEGVPHG